ncbi:hypothetical protein [Cellvibrio sp.]|uniref:hypothetical protein n=1 Tax=Cellvibrio sp. TaxID=1965322 RepID=UPI00396473DC
MSDKTQEAIFAREVQRRVEDLITWIIENSPDKNRVLSREDFHDAKQNLCGIVAGDTNLQLLEPEPEQGGAQYINDNPAPWP